MKLITTQYINGTFVQSKGQETFGLAAVEFQERTSTN
jgi:hypothetical protein